MNGYELSRMWFDFCFENPEKVKPNHSAIYFFAIEHCNRLGWKDKFGLPSTMTMEAVGIKSYNTYIKSLNEIIEWGFIEMVEKSKNQYSSNIIALSNFNKANNKALNKALMKHTSKQSESTVQSIDSINKLLTNKPLNLKTKNLLSELYQNLKIEFEGQEEILEMSAYDFLKKEDPSKVESFEMQNRKSIPDFDVFIQNFNAKVITEEIPFESKKLHARLMQLNANWDKNKKKPITKPSFSINR